MTDKGQGVLFGLPSPPLNTAASPFVRVQKRPKRNTISLLPNIRDEIVRKFPRSNYLTLMMAQAITEQNVDATDYCTTESPDLRNLGFLTEM
jgi:hypothetical protein